VTKNEVVQRLQEIRRVASEVRNLINSGAPGDKVHETISEPSPGGCRTKCDARVSSA
jgi:hypothetical protein